MAILYCFFCRTLEYHVSTIWFILYQWHVVLLYGVTILNLLYFKGIKTDFKHHCFHAVCDVCDSMSTFQWSFYMKGWLLVTPFAVRLQINEAFKPRS